MEAIEIRGSCQCGALAYEASGAPLYMVNCHCQMCRKMHGADYVTFLAMPPEGFSWLTDTALLRSYRATPPIERTFCGQCSAPLTWKARDQEAIWLVAGSLDDDPGLVPQEHIFVAYKAPWHVLDDGLPKHQG